VNSKKNNYIYVYFILFFNLKLLSLSQKNIINYDNHCSEVYSSSFNPLMARWPKELEFLESSFESSDSVEATLLEGRARAKDNKFIY
jgi:hypothetical protein